MFLGEYDHALDDRGRLTLPARFRAELEHGLYITRGLDRCLVILDSAAWTAMAERVHQLDPWQADARRMQRHFFAGAVQAVPDKLGRVVVPQYLRAYAGLETEVVVVGLGDRIEVWARPEWERERLEAETGNADLAEHLARTADAPPTR
jgi:MraZ protein